VEKSTSGHSLEKILCDAMVMTTRFSLESPKPYRLDQIKSKPHDFLMNTVLAVATAFSLQATDQRRNSWLSEVWCTHRLD